MADNFNPADIKALAFDLDGTLLRTDKVLSGRTLKALRSCMDRGIRVILSTGRAVESGEVYRKIIGAAGPQVYYNGAEVVEMPGGKSIFTRFIDTEPVAYAASLAEELGVYFQVYFPSGTIGEGEVLMANRLGEESDYYRRMSGVQAIAGDLGGCLSKVKQLIKGLFITGEEHQRKIRSALDRRCGTSIYVVSSSARYLEVLANGVSKGVGLAYALKHLGIKARETLVFGDEENDLPMFAAAGFSAAPANARPPLLEAATFRIASNDEDGPAAFLEEKFPPLERI
ncbi:MAG: HAD family hydrolase [Treponema sp.]|jgi:Cof subfamily protein (haloacid dehalogenase superfamily)|nr:HAD family hydrolase [Treponema sp.]